MAYINTKSNVTIAKSPTYNVAFAIDWQDDVDEMNIVFVGATADMLNRLFTYICGAGIAKGFTIEEQHQAQYRHCVVWDMLCVCLDNFNRQMATTETLTIVIERWLHKNVIVNYVDLYDINDLLNLRGHSPELLLNKKTEQEETSINNEEGMAYIALKVPWYVAAHFRGRDEDHQLTEWEPVKFTDFDHEYRVMVNNLRNIPEQNQSRICLSQRAFQNILHGKKPEGGLTILQRQATDWPSPQETATLTGCQMSARHSSSDYLLIEMPRETWLNKHVYRTNSCYTLNSDSAYFLASMLTDRFCYEYTQWFYADQRMARSQGFKRKQLESVERYFVQYNYPVIIDPKLRESMRRQHNRFIKKGNSKPSHGLQFDHSFLEHVSDDELKKIEANKKKKDHF